jgi:hypothetical protein
VTAFALELGCVRIHCGIFTTIRTFSFGGHTIPFLLSKVAGVMVILKSNMAATHFGELISERLASICHVGKFMNVLF